MFIQCQCRDQYGYPTMHLLKDVKKISFSGQISDREYVVFICPNTKEIYRSAVYNFNEGVMIA